MSPTPKPLRFGVIGCGGMASQVHCPNMKAIPDTQLVAYCDIDEKKAKALIEALGGEYTTTNADRIFADPSLDGILIQVGPALHPRFVQAAARAGKHVFCEKPIAIDLQDALETVRVVEKSGIQFMFGVCNRLAPLVRMAHRMCPQPLYSYCQCTDSVTGQACHNLDLAIHLFHSAPLQLVYGSGGQHWNLDPHLPADSFSAILTFADGSVHTYIQHGLSFNSLLSKYHYQLFGKNVCVFLAKRFKECHYMHDRNAPARSWTFVGQDMDRGPYGYMGHYDELAEWVDKIRHGGKCTMTIRQAARVLAVEKAILQSLVEKRAVDFPEFLRQNDAAFLLEKENA